MDPPILNVPSEICINMQAGLVKDSVKVDTSDLTLRTLKEYACNFIDRKVMHWTPYMSTLLQQHLHLRQPGTNVYKYIQTQIKRH